MISVTNLTVQYGNRVLFDNVNFKVDVRDRIGLVGRNGAGKSTLLKIIAGFQSGDEGTVTIPNNSTLGFLHQDLQLPKGKTVIDEALTAFAEAKKLEKRIEQINVELGERTDYETDSYMQLVTDLADATDRFQLLGGNKAEAEAERILSGLGFKSSDMNRLTDEFSGGWKMRIELAKILLRQPNYMLLDEPTNHLDIESIIWLERFLKDYSGSIITISHDKTFLDGITNRTVEIEMGKVYDYKAAYSKYRVMRVERKALQEAAYRNQQKVIAERERTISRFMAKATKTKMAQSMQKQLDKMERITLESEDTSAMKLRFPPAPRSGQVVVEAKNLIKKYDALTVLNEVDFKMDRGDRVAFVGQNGQGKTTLSKIIAQLEPISGGECKLGYNVEIGYYAQNQAEAMFPNSTVLETLEGIAPEHMRTRVRSILGAFMFSGEDVDKKVKVLSGGERARLSLACLLLKPFNLLILDEPTNHLDMISKEVLKQALNQYEGSLIVVSHDRDFLQGLTNRTLEFRDKKLYDYIGDVYAFLKKREVDNMRDVEKMTQSTISTKVERKTKLSYKEQKELQRNRRRFEKKVEKAEKLIEKLEKTIKDIEIKMAKSDFYGSPDEAKTIETYQQSKVQLEQTMEAWEDAQFDLEVFLEENGE
ncbi:MAG: ABC-F family ATP-binding cassette domain-containing protein [Saprospiraceae bacterium]